MTKRTHKLKALGGDVAAVIASAPSLSAAARTLGVDRSSVHRWIASGKVEPPKHRRRTASGTTAHQRHTPESWARWVRKSYTLSPTEGQLLDLAVKALALAADETKPAAVRLQAAARFQSLARQLDLEQEALADGEVEKKADIHPWPRRVG